MLTLEDIRIELGDFSLEAGLAVAPGRKVAVLGPSGSGKSTLLAAIAGFVSPAHGRILWQGEDITADAPAARPVSMLFQDNNLFPHMTAAQNVALGISPSLRLSRDEQVDVEEALERVGLSDMATRKPGQLSGGQNARVALARAALRHRPLMLLDEPFAALGPALKSEMLSLVEALATEHGATLLMVSHDPEDARRIADEVILVAEGRAAPPRPTAEIFADPPPALRDYLGQGPQAGQPE